MVRDGGVNIMASFPFMILMIAMIPFTRMGGGLAIWRTTASVQVTIAAAPFAARLIEGSLREVDPGVIEAAKACGASDTQIIFRVMLKEALPAIVLNISVLAIALLGYSAMAGAIGGGGLGSLAYNNCYIRYETEYMIWSAVVRIALVQVIQSTGNCFY